MNGASAMKTPREIRMEYIVRFKCGECKFARDASASDPSPSATSSSSPSTCIKSSLSSSRLGDLNVVKSQQGHTPYPSSQQPSQSPLGPVSTDSTINPIVFFLTPAPPPSN
ncbi:hypothetical protein JAAARDRAFT_198502 [Jaapia argillacea MUCL 33604]|uniref:Uncharacterized protein n=1 Tax=Jaapia argillacea MUCL 33604 TaxID=933084 RepID=A0A067PBE3_9AGAM|nr:hypothetical protein JAAARDRAFT_198502 [Jaapia argillacea MUCL 33604]